MSKWQIRAAGGHMEKADGIYKADLQIELKGFKNFQEEIPVDTKNASA